MVHSNQREAQIIIDGVDVGVVTDLNLERDEALLLTESDSAHIINIGDEHLTLGNTSGIEFVPTSIRSGEEITALAEATGYEINIRPPSETESLFDNSEAELVEVARAPPPTDPHYHLDTIQTDPSITSTTISAGTLEARSLPIRDVECDERNLVEIVQLLTAYQSVVDPIRSHDRNALRSVVTHLKGDHDGDYWAVGEMLERTLNLLSVISYTRTRNENND